VASVTENEDVKLRNFLTIFFQPCLYLLKMGVQICYWGPAVMRTIWHQKNTNHKIFLQTPNSIEQTNLHTVLTHFPSQIHFQEVRYLLFIVVNVIFQSRSGDFENMWFLQKSLSLFLTASTADWIAAGFQFPLSPLSTSKYRILTT
jgi:hypothetical protein